MHKQSSACTCTDTLFFPDILLVSRAGPWACRPVVSAHAPYLHVLAADALVPAVALRLCAEVSQASRHLQRSQVSSDRLLRHEVLWRYARAVPSSTNRTEVHCLGNWMVVTRWGFSPPHLADLALASRRLHEEDQQLFFLSGSSAGLRGPERSLGLSWNPGRCRPLGPRASHPHAGGGRVVRVVAPPLIQRGWNWWGCCSATATASYPLAKETRLPAANPFPNKHCITHLPLEIRSYAWQDSGFCKICKTCSNRSFGSAAGTTQYVYLHIFEMLGKHSLVP